MEVSTNEWEVLGVDANASTNFMRLSDGGTISLSRPLMNQVNRFKRDFAGKEVKYNKTNKKKFDSRKSKVDINVEYHMERKVDELIDHALQKGIYHIVLEDIQGLDAKLDGDLSGWIGLERMKKEIQKAAEKCGIAVSLVQPQFTSQTCPNCFHIEKENRATRDKFVCKHCGYRGNADKIAAINILRRVTEPTLRERLLIFTGENYIPKPNVTIQDIFDAYHEVAKEKYFERKAKREKKAEAKAVKAEKAATERMKAFTRRRAEDAKRMKLFLRKHAHKKKAS